jgi:bisphosphoglycerate-dependent phosphoglycerate mutase
VAAILRCRAARRRKPQGHVGARRAFLLPAHSAPRAARRARAGLATHGNSVRALAMVLDQMTPESATTLELATGVPVIYTLNADSTVASKDVVE